MNTPIASGLPPIPTRVFSRPSPTEPVLLTSLASAAILNGAGEFSLIQDTRGAPLDWGGVYAQGVRLTGPWRILIDIDGKPLDTASTFERFTAFRWASEGVFATPDARLTQSVVALAEPAGVLRRLAIESRRDAPSRVIITSEIDPFLAPVLVEGIRPYEFQVSSNPSQISLDSHGYGLRLAHSLRPSEMGLDHRPWKGEPFAGEVSSFASRYELTIPPRGRGNLDWILWGGLRHSIQNRPNAGAAALDDCGTYGQREAAMWTAWRNLTPTLSFPDAPWLEDAYRSARDSIRSLYTAPDADLTGLVAGYPWYSTIWCRDLAWALPAVLWLGDHDWVERSIRTVFRFQSRSDLPILGGHAGELPMQISPGPIFLYGTSDTSLHYPRLVQQLAATRGDLALAREFLSPLQRLAAWAQAKTESTTGLFHNGGELLALRATSESVGKVHYGFNAEDTTIWDSTDRRDHAIDVQVLWADALASLAQIGATLGEVGPARAWAKQSEALSTRIPDAYRWSEEEYLLDSLHTDGWPVQRVRPNALRAVSAGLLSHEKALRVVRRATRDDLTTPWGVRTLSSLDPGYRPAAYHDGQVWSIATAWAADAALAVGDSKIGLEYLRCCADRLLQDPGVAHECYRGDRPEPFNSCFLLGFSVGPFLTTIFERLWGLSVDALQGTLKVDPQFPEDWTKAKLVGLKVGGGTVDLEWSPKSISARWTGPGTLVLERATAQVSLSPDVPALLELPKDSVAL